MFLDNLYMYVYTSLHEHLYVQLPSEQSVQHQNPFWKRKDSNWLLEVFIYSFIRYLFLSIPLHVISVSLLWFAFWWKMHKDRSRIQPQLKERREIKDWIMTLLYIWVILLSTEVLYVVSVFAMSCLVLTNQSDKTQHHDIYCMAREVFSYACETDCAMQYFSESYENCSSTFSAHVWFCTYSIKYIWTFVKVYHGKKQFIGILLGISPWVSQD